MRIPKLKKDYVNRTVKLRMSNKAMADFMYALIITKSTIENSLGIGIYEYTRKQNNTNSVDFMIGIHPDNIDNFEETAGVKLKEPIQIVLN